MSTPIDFYDWLIDTRALQVEAFGIDPATLNGDDFAEYIRWNVLAAQVELVEVLGELRWKPWKADTGRPNDEERERAVEEIADVLHFVANLLVALRVGGHELSRAYRAKQQVNRDRQAAQAEEAAAK